MGTGKTYEVHVWKLVGDQFYYEMVCATNWVVLAAIRMLFEKRKGFGCVKIEMR